MNSKSIDVPYIAHLARLNLSKEETEQFQSQLGQVLAYVEQLKKLDVARIEPTAHAIQRTNVFRLDDVTSSLAIEKVLSNAPQKMNDLFLVPKVVE